MLRFKCRFASLKYSLFGLIFLTACSNPLSNDHSNQLPNFHTKNINCDDLNFSEAKVTANQTRSLIHCLNSQKELDALENLSDSLTDQELNPLVDLLNTISEEQPQFLYSMKTAYLTSVKDGTFDQLENTLLKLISEPKLNSAIVNVLRKNAKPFTEILLNPKWKSNFSGLYALLNAKSFQRLGQEYFIQDPFIQLFTTIRDYRKSSDSISLTGLYDMLSKSKMTQEWENLLARDTETHLQNLAHFYEWFFEADHYEAFSVGVHEIQSEPIECFNGNQSIPNPLASVIKNLSSMNPTEAAHYLTHDISNLYLVAQGYCRFPYGVSKLLNLVQEATQTVGYAETYTLFQPLFQDERFLQFLGSSASRTFVNEGQFLLNQHFFQDVFTLIEINRREPLSNDGAPIAALLDSLFQTLESNEVRTLYEFSKPLLSRDEEFGFRLVKLTAQITSGFSPVKLNLSNSLRSQLQASLINIIQKPSISETLDLAAKLMRTDKLRGLLDQTIEYLNDLINRGAFSEKLTKFTPPDIVKAKVSSYLLPRVFDGAFQRDIDCFQIQLDWSFFQTNSSADKPYLMQIDQILNCLNPNQTFKSAKELILYSSSKSEFGYFLNLQKSAIDTIFELDKNLSLRTLEDVLSVSSKDSFTIRKLLETSSELMSPLRESFLSKGNLRQLMGSIVEDPSTYESFAELSESTPSRSQTSAPTLDLKHLKKINAIVTKETKLKDAPVVDAINAMFKEYCPSLNELNPDCDIDSSQLALYRVSAQTLFNSIVDDYLNNSSSWLHPGSFTEWTHSNELPTQVSNLNYHLNPALHLFRDSPQAATAIFGAVKRIAQDKMSIGAFLRDRATRLTLIPYVFQVPNYPSEANKEYTNRVRIRIVSDIDRLELIANNADFKAFGLVNNIGMGFIREIALAWGDVPLESRPVSLSQFENIATSKTQKEVRDSIERQMSKFDSNALQALGACDPRGRGLFGRILANSACNSEVFDISARIFNLRFLISLLTDELPVKDGGFGGMEFLRDLFYGLYEKNSDQQRDQFANGVSLRDACLDNPLRFSSTPVQCKKDLLTLIPRVTHLGLLHQAGLAILNHQDHPVDQISSLIERVAANPALTDSTVKLLSSANGIQLINDAVDFGFQAPNGIGISLGQFTQLLSTSADLNWVQLLLDIAAGNPHFIRDNQLLLNTLFTKNTEDFKPWLDFFLSHPNSPNVRMIQNISTRVNKEVRTDFVQWINEFSPHSNQTANALSKLKNLPALSQPQLNRDGHDWFITLASEQGRSTRVSLKNWIQSKQFDEFCAVFSDATFVSKTYNFLEAINQNPDSKIFLRSCEDFLNVH